MPRSVIAYDKNLPGIASRCPLEKPISFLVKNDTAPTGWRENTCGVRPSHFSDNIVFQTTLDGMWQLFSFIQGIVDARMTSGMFILTASDQYGLMEGVTQSLAGRTALFKLLPFSFDESASFFKGVDPDSRMLRGSWIAPEPTRAATGQPVRRRRYGNGDAPMM